MENNSPLKFPCVYPLKIIGLADSVEAAALPILRKHIPDLGEGAFKLRPSRDKKYLAITVQITVKSQKQLDDLYVELSSCKDVIMAL